LKNVKTLSQDSYFVLNYALLNENDARVCSFLKEHWHLALNYFSFKDVYKEKMINDPIDTDSFIVNKSLINKATQIEHSLQDYMILV
jgi:hypothetical protein